MVVVVLVVAVLVVAVLVVAVLVVKWSVCSPSILTIRVQILLKPTVFSVKFAFEKNKNRPGLTRQ